MRQVLKEHRLFGQFGGQAIIAAAVHRPDQSLGPQRHRRRRAFQQDARAQELDRQRAETVDTWINALSREQLERLACRRESITDVVEPIPPHVVAALEWWAERYLRNPTPDEPEPVNPARLTPEGLHAQIEAELVRLGVREFVKAWLAFAVSRGLTGT